MRVIKLKSNGIGRYDDVSPFMITDNMLELETDLPPLNGEFYITTENNGVKSTRLISRSGTVVIDSLTAGELNAEVRHYLKGTLIKTYKIEPLLLIEADGNINAEPEIAALRRENAKLREEVVECAATAEIRAKRDRGTFAALLKVVWALYQTNIYLDEMSFERFADIYGFKLTDAEIKLIKGEKETDEN